MRPCCPDCAKAAPRKQAGAKPCCGDLRAAIQREARRWLGTPFHHGQRLHKKGVDCLGLIWSVGENAKAMPRLTDNDLAPFMQFYGRRPAAKVMRQALERFLVEIPAAEAMPGDVAWMHWGNQIPVHFAILAERDSRRTLVHAVLDMSVVEHGWEAEYRRRVKSWWRYPALAGQAS